MIFLQKLSLSKISLSVLLFLIAMSGLVRKNLWVRRKGFCISWFLSVYSNVISIGVFVILKREIDIGRTECRSIKYAVAGILVMVLLHLHYLTFIKWSRMDDIITEVQQLQAEVMEKDKENESKNRSLKEGTVETIVRLLVIAIPIGLAVLLIPIRDGMKTELREDILMCLLLLMIVWQFNCFFFLPVFGLLLFAILTIKVTGILKVGCNWLKDDPGSAIKMRRFIRLHSKVCDIVKKMNIQFAFSTAVSFVFTALLWTHVITSLKQETEHHLGSAWQYLDTKIYFMSLEDKITLLVLFLMILSTCACFCILNHHLPNSLKVLPLCFLQESIWEHPNDALDAAIYTTSFMLNPTEAKFAGFIVVDAISFIFSIWDNYSYARGTNLALFGCMKMV